MSFEDWYLKTFSSELSLLEGTSLVKFNDKSEKSEERALRRRLDAVDAIETLMGPLFPIPREDWEVDISICHQCHKALGWLQLRPKHHCRFCGKTFCNDCCFGEVRSCHSCEQKKQRYEVLQLLRAFERDATKKPSVESVLSVTRMYRVAIQSFSEIEEEEAAKEARMVLIEGLHSFLDLQETRGFWQQPTTSAPD